MATMITVVLDAAAIARVSGSAMPDGATSIAEYERWRRAYSGMKWPESEIEQVVVELLLVGNTASFTIAVGLA